MSPAASYLKQGGFDRVGPVKGMRGFEVWHRSKAGCADIAVAIPDHEHAEVDWAVYGLFSAGEQQGQTTIREHWLKLDALMKMPPGHIGKAALPETEETKEP